jgi:hypothetical protein
LIGALEALGAELVVFRDPIIDDLIARRVGCDALAMFMAHALRVVSDTPTLPNGMIEKSVAYSLAVLVGHDHQDSIFAHRHGFDLAEGGVGSLVGPLLGLRRGMRGRTQDERQCESDKPRTSRSHYSDTSAHRFSPFISLNISQDRALHKTLQSTIGILIRTIAQKSTQRLGAKGSEKSMENRGALIKN